MKGFVVNLLGFIGVTGGIRVGTVVDGHLAGNFLFPAEVHVRETVVLGDGLNGVAIIARDIRADDADNLGRRELVLDVLDYVDVGIAVANSTLWESTETFCRNFSRRFGFALCLSAS